MHPNTNDMTGMVFGRLTVIKPTKKRSKGRDIIWLCRCVCGSYKEIIGYSVRSGSTKSCGCLHKEAINGKFGQSILNKTFIGYKNSASKRGLDFKLSKELFSEIISLNCAYCGAPPKKKYIEGLQGFCELSGIDRIDNTAGYIEGNCISCCGICNRMKSTMTKDDFILHIRNIYEFNNEK